MTVAIARTNAPDLHVDVPDDDRPTVLDVLLAAQYADAQLAFRYGCRNALCGVCTVRVNGKPKLACRDRVRDGDRIEPLAALPTLRDLVVARAGVSRQLRRLAAAAPPRATTSRPMTAASPDAPTTTARAATTIPTTGSADARTEHDGRYDRLGACIDCYACLETCPLHARNDVSGEAPEAGYRWGNPYSLLVLQRAIDAPAATPAQRAASIRAASALGLSTCATCAGCRCGVGIRMGGDVIAPLLARADTREETP